MRSAHRAAEKLHLEAVLLLPELAICTVAARPTWTDRDFLADPEFPHITAERLDRA
jgi:hypothetical protein